MFEQESHVEYDSEQDEQQTSLLSDTLLKITV